MGIRICKFMRWSMSEKTSEILKTILCDGRGSVFIAAAGLVVFAFILELTLALCLNGYGVKKRVRFFACSAAAIFLQFASCLYSGEYAPLFIIAAFASILCGAIITIPERRAEITDKQRELVRFIDGSLKKAEQESVRAERPRREVYAHEGKGRGISALKAFGETPSGKIKPCDIDCDHVRAVLSRLDYYALSAADKKTVNDLSSAIAVAERGEIDDGLKEKINDGLGALLKIMSKYGT